MTPHCLLSQPHAGRSKCNELMKQFSFSVTNTQHPAKLHTEATKPLRVNIKVELQRKIEDDMPDA